MKFFKETWSEDDGTEDRCEDFWGHNYGVSKVWSVEMDFGLALKALELGYSVTKNDWLGDGHSPLWLHIINDNLCLVSRSGHGVWIPKDANELLGRKWKILDLDPYE